MQEDLSYWRIFLFCCRRMIVSCSSSPCLSSAGCLFLCLSGWCLFSCTLGNCFFLCLSGCRFPSGSFPLPQPFKPLVLSSFLVPRFNKSLGSFEILLPSCIFGTNQRGFFCHLPDLILSVCNTLFPPFDFGLFQLFFCSVVILGESIFFRGGCSH